MPFFQTPPSIPDPFESDRVLRSYLARVLPTDAARTILPTLAAMGALAGGELFRLQADDRLNEPRLTQWDAWGNRVDRIDVTPLWQRAKVVACEHGLVATAYERKHGALSRVHQFALAYLFEPSSDVYTCPLAMTDGAAKTLLTHANAANKALVERAVPRLTSRDPRLAWTSGQWMTERTGGSDVGISETVARHDGEHWRLFGTKWFTSATTSEMALTLARPEGNPPGGIGLALFYLERALPDGTSNGVLVNRLKDKLGTRKVPTAELTLDGARALPVVDTREGVKNIAPMLNVTRTWNAVGAIGGMRRAIALVRDYADRRVAFGAKLSEKPLHLDTLAGMQAELEGAFHLTFRAVELLGKEEARELDPRESDLLRLLTPIVKLTTGKQAVAVASEACEAFGGAGYVEDTGIPRLLRDAQVLPIWEGTTNVLALDTLRALAKPDRLGALEEEVREAAGAAKDAALGRAGRAAIDAVGHAKHWLLETMHDRPALEAGARRFALTLGRSLELALLVRHAQWSLDVERDGRARAAALRLARHGVDLVAIEPGDGDARLARDEPIAV
ncbi:MAG: acyl-CoA dehydrogenase family protein [Polyangiales bacterium]